MNSLLAREVQRRTGHIIMTHGKYLCYLKNLSCGHALIAELQWVALFSPIVAVVKSWYCDVASLVTNCKFLHPLPLRLARLYDYIA